MVKQFKQWFKNLCYGLLKLHQNRIINKDIKLENLTALYNTSTNEIQVRFIDFGLSENLTKEYCKKYDNIGVSGTYAYLSPDIFVSSALNEYYNYDDYHNYQKKSDSYIISKIKEDIKNYTKDKHKELQTEYINVINDIVIKQYYTIKGEFDSHDILNKYFGIDDHLK